MLKARHASAALHILSSTVLFAVWFRVIGCAFHMLVGLMQRESFMHEMHVEVGNCGEGKCGDR